MSRKKILVLDDDLDIVELLEYLLRKNGYQPIGIIDSRNVKEVISRENFSLLIVDRNLPCREGTDLVKELRQKGINTPVIFLTAKNSKSEKIEGFNSGGDDYITKPFDTEELLVRVEALLRRVKSDNKKINILSYRDIDINLDLLEATINNRVIELTKLEFNLLQTFIQNKNIVLDRDYLLDRVWQCGVFDDKCNGKTVNVAIKRLKEKIDPDKSKAYIKSVRGVGYKLA